MTLARRRLLHLAAAAAAVPAASRLVWAQAYPNRPLRFIVGYPPGGGADNAARIMGSWLAERLGQPVVIENRPGGGTNISVQAVVNAPPDGYTLLFLPSSAAINVSFYAPLALRPHARHRAARHDRRLSDGARRRRRPSPS